MNFDYFLAAEWFLTWLASAHFFSFAKPYKCKKDFTPDDDKGKKEGHKHDKPKKEPKDGIPLDIPQLGDPNSKSSKKQDEDDDDPRHKVSVSHVKSLTTPGSWYDTQKEGEMPKAGNMRWAYLLLQHRCYKLRYKPWAQKQKENYAYL